MEIVSTGPGYVLVPTLTPLGEFHADQLDGRTRCGLPTHGWYPMTRDAATANADTPCRDCFAVEAAQTPRQRQGGPR